MWWVAGMLFVFTSLDLYAVTQGKKRLEYISKPMLMPLVAIAYVLSLKEWNVPILIGLFFGWLGDIFLMSKKEKFFLAGLSSFLAGHLFYIYAFFQDIRPEAGKMSLYFFVITLYILIDAFVYKKLFPLLEKRVKLPVAMYMFVISLMSYVAFLRLVSLGSRGIPVYAGSLFFMLSDTVLSFFVFGDSKRKERASVTIMTSYVAAQFLVAMGMV